MLGNFERWWILDPKSKNLHASKRWGVETFLTFGIRTNESFLVCLSNGKQENELLLPRTVVSFQSELGDGVICEIVGDPSERCVEG